MFALMLTLAALAIWLYQDAGRRQMNSPLAWVALLVLTGPFALALYWARRPLYAGEYRVGGRIWVMMRVFVLALSVWMLMFAAVLSVWLSDILSGPALVTLMLGTGLLLGGGWSLIAMTLLLAAWLLRDRRAEIGPTHAALAGQSAPTPGDGLLRVILLGGLLAVFIFTEPAHPDWVDEVEWQQLPDRAML